MFMLGNAICICIRRISVHFIRKNKFSVVAFRILDGMENTQEFRKSKLTLAVKLFRFPCLSVMKADISIN